MHKQTINVDGGKCEHRANAPMYTTFSDENIMIKFTILLTRKPELTHAQFVEHHKTVHAGLFLSIPAVNQTVRRYVQQHAIAADLPGMPPTP